MFMVWIYEELFYKDKGTGPVYKVSKKAVDGLQSAGGSWHMFTH